MEEVSFPQRTALLLGLSVFVVCGCLAAAHAQTKPTVDLLYDIPVHAEFPVPPRPFYGDDGKLHLVYFLFLTNFSHADLRVEQVEIADADSGAVLQRLDASTLERPGILQTTVGEPSGTIPSRNILRPGRVVVMRAFLTLPGEPPKRLRHRLTFKRPEAYRIANDLYPQDGPVTLELQPLPLGPPAPVIAAPLRGGPWRTSGAASPMSYHLGLSTISGRARLGELFAIDFQKVDKEGNILPNPFPYDINNEMFYSNRAELLAVGDGTVALVRDGIPENKPTPSGDENMPVPLTRQTTGGNTVSIRLKDGSYALYCHIATGTIRVKVGDQVRSGQVIGLIGNSGNAKNPHLHFEMADNPEINAGQGLPYEFSTFGLYGHHDGKTMPAVDRPPVVHKREMPLDSAIVKFSDKSPSGVER